LKKVSSRCNKLSLQKQLFTKSSTGMTTIGDVLIQGGSRGHAMLIVDMAVNSVRQKLYLLLQGFMPAQDIHVVVNL
jgi:hypothetical protein